MFDSYGVRTSLDEFGVYGSLLNGGPGSGDFGHYGRPGEVGGSASSGSPTRTRAKKAEYEKKGGKSDGGDSSEKSSKKDSSNEDAQKPSRENYYGAKVTKYAEQVLNYEGWEHIKEALLDELSKCEEYGVDLTDFEIDVKDLGEDVFASANASRLNLSRDLDKKENGGPTTWKADREKGKRSWLTDSSVQATIRHELGHAKSKQQEYETHTIIEDGLLLYAFGQSIKSKKVPQNSYNDLRKAGKIPVSKYGLTNIQETYAECFANRNYSNFANQFVENFDKAVADIKSGKLKAEDVMKSSLNGPTRKKWGYVNKNVKKIGYKDSCIGYFGSEEAYKKAKAAGLVWDEEE